MNHTSTLLHCDEAIRYIESIPDPITRSLVNLAFVHLVKKTHLQKQDRPSTDLDMVYLVKALGEFFSEHEVIARTLEGERVGAWFQDLR